MSIHKEQFKRETLIQATNECYKHQLLHIAQGSIALQQSSTIIQRATIALHQRLLQQHQPHIPLDSIALVPNNITTLTLTIVLLRLHHRHRLLHPHQLPIRLVSTAQVLSSTTTLIPLYVLPRHHLLPRPLLHLQPRTQQGNTVQAQSNTTIRIHLFAQQQVHHLQLLHQLGHIHPECIANRQEPIITQPHLCALQQPLHLPLQLNIVQHNIALQQNRLITR